MTDSVLLVTQQQQLVVQSDTGSYEIVRTVTTQQTLEQPPAANEILTVAQQGPPGIPGSGVSSPAIRRSEIAAENLSGHKVVYLDAAGAKVADKGTQATALAAVGITDSAASIGATVGIITYGKLVEPTWTWTPGPIYLGAAGALTQVLPTAPSLLVQVARALTATEIEVRIQPGLVLT